MSGHVLRVSGLGKAFRTYRSEWQRVLSWFGVSVIPAAEHWALRGVSFSVASGEAVGIVGQNGAGKSTLLKLITGTLRATEGEVQIGGRIAAILELGMGFNPEFTGRENVFHSAGLRGFGREAIEQAMPEIEAFAEIGEYFDQPLRTYSSGMQMRVAFSLATAFRPDVLIVDEALSVGDAYFKHKSFDRIREFQRLGTTLLIVSHDKSAVQTLCNRAVLLEKGRVIKDGNPEAVMDFYNALIAVKENQSIQVLQHESGKTQTISGTGEARVDGISLRSASGRSVEFVNVGEQVELCVRATVCASIPRLVLGYMIKDRLGQPMYGTNTHHTGQALEDLAEGTVINFRIRFTVALGPGSYSISTALVSSDTHLINNYEWKDLALLFSVTNLDKPFFVGSSWMEPMISIESLPSGGHPALDQNQEAIMEARG